MNICIVYMSRYPWDVRVEKIAKYLNEAGHKVHILCRTTEGHPRSEIEGNISIERMMLSRNGLHKLNRIFDLPFPLNPLWIHKIWRYSKRENIDLIIVRDIPLAIPSLVAGKLNGVPVVLDMAEDYSGMFSDFINDSPWPKRLPLFFLKNPYLASIVEKIVIRRVDHIFVVIEESRDRLLRQGVYPEKISIVSNTPRLARITPNRFDLPAGLKFVYVGQLQFARGIQTAIAGFSIILRNRKDIHLYIVGSGRQAGYFTKMINDLGLSENIHTLGWVKPDIAYDLVNSCDVGIIPPLNTRHISTTIPNKLFDYMLCSKPVLVSDAAPLKRIVEESCCGWVFKAGDEKDFAGKVLEISELDCLDQFGQNARKAIIDHYNWEYDSKLMHNVLNHVGKSR